VAFCFNDSTAHGILPRMPFCIVCIYLKLRSLQLC
jgi:hypothetical protein